MNALTVVSIVTLIAHVNGLDPRIIGGSPANAGQYPYQALVKQDIFGGFMLCGGSIITNRFVLTAAHCIYLYESAQCTVTVGTVELDGSGETYQAQKLIYHEEYDLKKIENDVGLIRVTKDIQFHKNVQPIALPDIDDVPRNATAVLTGWGKLHRYGSVASNLQQINLTVISEPECKAYWNISEGEICTLMKAGHGACQGDSGGPLVVNSVQVGIVSYGSVFCAAGRPDVFTKVSYYKPWIKNVLNRTYPDSRGHSSPSTQPTLLFVISVIALRLHSSW